MSMGPAKAARVPVTAVPYVSSGVKPVNEPKPRPVPCSTVRVRAVARGGIAGSAAGHAPGQLQQQTCSGGVSGEEGPGDSR